MPEYNEASDERRTHRNTQVLVDLPNGLTVSIITDGYGSESGLYEAMVTSHDGNAVQGIDDVLGYLDPAELGRLLTQVAKAELRTQYVLGEDDSHGTVTH